MDKKLIMTVRRGKFYRGDELVPIEHGNQEQIALLNRIAEMQDGFDPDDIVVKKKITMSFKCICGAYNEFDSFTELDEHDPDSMIIGETDTCHCCGVLFKVVGFREQYSESLQLKLIPKPVNSASEGLRNG